jgi:hypothetical protein
MRHLGLREVYNFWPFSDMRLNLHFERSSQLFTIPFPLSVKLFSKVAEHIEIALSVVLMFLLDST